MAQSRIPVKQLDVKVVSALTTTGTSGAATLSNGTLNIPTPNVVPTYTAFAAGVTTVTLGFTPSSVNQLFVFQGGGAQNTNTYSFSGTTLTFSSTTTAPGWVIGLPATQVSVGTPSDGTVTNAKLTAACVALANMQSASVNFASHTADSVATNAQAIAGTAANVFMTPAAQVAREQGRVVETTVPAGVATFFAPFPAGFNEYEVDLENLVPAVAGTISWAFTNTAGGGSPLTANTQFTYTGATNAPAASNGAGNNQFIFSVTVATVGGLGVLNMRVRNPAGKRRYVTGTVGATNTTNITMYNFISYDDNTGTLATGIQFTNTGGNFYNTGATGTAIVRIRGIPRYS